MGTNAFRLWVRFRREYEAMTSYMFPIGSQTPFGCGYVLDGLPEPEAGTWFIVSSQTPFGCGYVLDCSIK